MTLCEIAMNMKNDLAKLDFGPDLTHVYNPLEYAFEPHRAYLERYGAGVREVLLVGMNPGPWGMIQTGVPFGDVALVRDWLGIAGPVGQPRNPHPKRPVLGFACPRGEPSGRRLWGWAKARFGTPEAFFSRFFVGNYCPLGFFLEDGANLTPDKLPVEPRRRLQAVCDLGLGRTVAALRPRWVLGVGRFAERRVREVLAGTDVIVGGIPHPSPASPAANRGWTAQMEAALGAVGIELP